MLEFAPFDRVAVFDLAQRVERALHKLLDQLRR